MPSSNISKYIKELKVYIDHYFGETLTAEYEDGAAEQVESKSNLFEEVFPLPAAKSYSYARGKSEIEKIFKQIDISFSERLFRFIDERGMREPEVYNAANISKQVFHKNAQINNIILKKPQFLPLL